MPSGKRKGWIGRYVELPVDLDERFRLFVEGYGGRWAEHVRMAMERHMTYPPPPAVRPPVPPLPNGIKPKKKK